MLKQRAINQAQKEERRQQILQAAATLYQSTPYPDISMTAVAKQAGIAKGTVYLYFNTKEALFLALLLDEFSLWFAELETALSHSDSLTGPAFIALLGPTLKKRPQLIRLIAIQHTILERNIEAEAARNFKLALKRHVTHAAELLEARLSFLQAGQGVAVLLRLHALVIGFQHLSQPAPIVQTVLTDPDLALFQIEFLPSLLETFQIFLIGLEQRNKE